MSLARRLSLFVLRGNGYTMSGQLIVSLSETSYAASRQYSALPQLAEQYRGEDHNADRRLAEMQQAGILQPFILPVTSRPEQLDWKQALNAMHSDRAMLTDTFGRVHTYLRISLTEKCNLRCLYCMPEEGVELTPKMEILSTDEVVRLATLFASSGITKIRLTGGEPTLRTDIVDITSAISSLPGVQHVGLTTNGIVLERKLSALKDAGLSLLNISLDTLRPERFEAMTRRKGHDRVLRAIERAIELGFSPIKLNVVVMSGVNDDEIIDFVRFTRDKPVNVRFIEYMPFDGNVWKRKKMVGFKEMKAAVENSFGPLHRHVDPLGEVAKNYYIPGHTGSVSFITSMTSAFCSDCNRLRIMADGNLKVCLFGANEVSLRDAIREGASDEDLKAVISAAVDRKKAAHAGMFELAKTKNRAMIKIGG